jgi:hypothetical protein
LALSTSGIYCPDTNAQTGIGFDLSDFRKVAESIIDDRG